MNLPYGTETIPIEELLPELKDNKVSVDLMIILQLVADTHYAQGYADALELVIKKDKASE